MTTQSDFIHWSDAYLLGYEPMDETHREFVDGLQAMQSCPDTEFVDRLQAFRTHCESHFGQEKSWMEETQMPGRQCHIDEHASVSKSVNEVLALLRSEPSVHHIAIGRSMAAELGRWFPAHADHMDSALSHWMCTQRFGGKPVVIRRNGIGDGPQPGVQSKTSSPH